MINPILPPLNDLRLRQALALTLDWEQIFKAGLVTPAYGGIIPPGMAGYTPDLRLRFDPQVRRGLSWQKPAIPVEKDCLSCGQSPVKISAHFSPALTDRWQEELGIQVQINSKTATRDRRLFNDAGWVDGGFSRPGQLFRQVSFNYFLRKIGWEDPEYDQLIETAAGLQDRKQRLALYRQADRRSSLSKPSSCPFSTPPAPGSPW